MSRGELLYVIGQAISVGVRHFSLAGNSLLTPGRVLDHAMLYGSIIIISPFGETSKTSILDMMDSPSDLVH